MTAARGLGGCQVCQHTGTASTLTLELTAWWYTCRKENRTQAPLAMMNTANNTTSTKSREGQQIPRGW